VQQSDDHRRQIPHLRTTRGPQRQAHDLAVRSSQILAENEEGNANMKPFVALSLGWGVQSFTLAAMAALGEIEQPDVAIHADTTHEASGTYAFAQQWTPWLEEHGVRVVTVTRDLRPDPLNVRGGIDIPAYTETENGGMIRKQCTHDWKRRPIRQWLQSNRNRHQPVEQWLGISLDEIQRMKDSDVQYITNRWPLIERRISRLACKTWLERHDLPIPPKSACVFCPFHSDSEWHDARENGNGDWHKAVEVDEMIRNGRPPYDLFVHRTMQPLALVDFSNAEERGQLSLWNDECSGICGV